MLEDYLEAISQGREIQSIVKSNVSEPLTKEEVVIDNFEKGLITEELFDTAMKVLEKGGKPAVIGEVREFGGKKYHKTAKGWRPVPKGGLEKKEEAVIKKEEKEVSKDISKVKIQSNLEEVLELAQPLIDDMVDKFVKRTIKERTAEYEGLVAKVKEGKVHLDEGQLQTRKARIIPSEFDIKMYQLGITIDLIEAFGRYIKSDDSIKVSKFNNDKGAIVIHCDVTREGVTYPMSTELIYAGGYNIQQLHYRYISHTKLPANANNTAADNLIKEKSKLTKEQKINAEIEYLNNWVNRDIENINKEKVKTIDDIAKEKVWLTDGWHKYSDEAKARYGSKDNYLAELKRKRDEEMEEHQRRYSDKRIAAIKKEHQTKLAKLEDKLKALNN
jgi:hypothetical protein